MGTSQAAWQDWIAYLKSRGMATLTASLLEAVAPLSLLFSQLLFTTQPVLSGLVPADHFSALTDLMENREDYMQFISSLKGPDQ